MFWMGSGRQAINLIISVLLFEICLNFEGKIFFTLGNDDEIGDGSGIDSEIHIDSDTQYDERLYVNLPSTFRSQVNFRDFKMENSSSIENLRDQLAFEFPYNGSASIPRVVWQTWKHSVDHEEFPNYYKPLVDFWKNKTDNYFLITDDQIMPLLEDLYYRVPLVLEAIRSMPMTILKIDFFRYLLLYAEGGIYSDLDTLPLKPLESWASINDTALQDLFTQTDVTNKRLNYQKLTKSGIDEQPIQKFEPGLVIGIEADPDREDWNDWYARRIQFCQWTIQAKPGHPVLRELIVNITSTTLYSVLDTHDQFLPLVTDATIDYAIEGRISKLNDDLSLKTDLKTQNNVDGTDIMNWTGPGIFTDIIFEYFNNLLQKNEDVLILNRNIRYTNYTLPNQKFYKRINYNLNYKNIIPWEFFSLITEPVIVDDVMILPITSFSPEVNQMGSKSREDPMAYVLHLFRGTWKTKADANKKHKQQQSEIS